jgi:hypothetical protein
MKRAPAYRRSDLATLRTGRSASDARPSTARPSAGVTRPPRSSAQPSASDATPRGPYR